MNKVLFRDIGKDRMSKVTRTPITGLIGPLSRFPYKIPIRRSFCKVSITAEIDKELCEHLNFVREHLPGLRNLPTINVGENADKTHLLHISKAITGPYKISMLLCLSMRIMVFMSRKLHIMVKCT